MREFVCSILAPIAITPSGNMGQDVRQKECAYGRALGHSLHNPMRDTDHSDKN